MKFTIFLIVSFFLISATNGYNILMLLPFPGPSHFLMFKVFIKELISRGHEVTAITAFKFGENLQNYTEIHINPEFPLREKFSVKELFAVGQSSDFEKINMYYWMGLDTTEWCLNNSRIQKFIKREDLHFDLIFAEQFFQESLLMLAYKFNAPIVTLSTYGPSDFFDRVMGALTPWSYVPHMVILDYGDDMTYTQRCYNFILSMTDALLRKYYYMPRMNQMAKNYFKHLEGTNPLPSVEELENSISVILVNSDFSMNPPRPQIPGIVNIAGAHIKSPKPLPKDLQEFLDEAKHGAIYFSLGAYMQSALMPHDTFKAIMNVFKSLKQRILWKYEADNIPDCPPNVLVKKWMPQNDILAHENIVLFISHGGLFGTIEGTHRGVPILFIPFFGDQHRNAKIAQKQGYALTQEFQTLTEQDFKTKILELIDNKKYLENAQQMSKLLRDNPIHPMDNAMFWIEHVARTKGAKYLKSASTKLNWFQYLSLDIIGSFLLALFFVLWAVKKVLQKILKVIKMSKTETSSQKKKNL